MNKTSKSDLAEVHVLSPQFYVYVLFSLKDYKLYIGYTTNIQIRVQEHMSGYVTATQNRLPVQLIFYESFVSRPDARAREKFLKSGFGRNQLKKALKQTLKGLTTNT